MTDHSTEEPQVFAVSRPVNGRWTFQRRSFLRAASAAAGVGLLAGCSSDKKDSPDTPPTATAMLSFSGAYADSDGIESLALSADGTLLAAGSIVVMVNLWLMPDGAKLSTRVSGMGVITSLAFSPDKSLLAVGCRNGAIWVWKLTTNSVEMLVSLDDHTDEVSSLVFSTDGKMLISSGYDKTIRLWSIPDGKLIQTLSDHPYVVCSLALSPDGTRLASGSQFGDVRLWTMPECTPLYRLDGHQSDVVSLEFSPDGLLLAAACWDNTVRVSSLAESEGTLIHTLEGHTNLVHSVAFSRDGTRLASGSQDRTVRLWSAADGTLIHTLEKHDDAVRAVVFSPDVLISAGWDKTIKLWSPSDGTYLGDLVDIAVTGDHFQAVQYGLPDGSGVITLPCGSSLPNDASCICNCVTGSACSCVGAGGTGSGGGHYWHPN